MAWKQLRTPNLGISYTGGWCLLAVRTAFGITKAVYPTAMADWLAGENGKGNHHELPPKGVAVPVYFSLGSEPAGHVAISLPDGRVASSTKSGTHQGLYIHPNLNDLIAVYAKYNTSCTYLGWSEGTENVAVVAAVAGGEEPNTGGTEDMTTEDYLSDIFDVIADDPWYAETKPDVFKNHVAYVKSLDWAGRRAWFKQVLTDNGVLAKTRMAEHVADDKAYQARAESEMNNLSQQVIDSTVKLESATEEQQRTLAGKDAEIKDLTAQLDKALQNAKDVSRWSWQDHLAAAIRQLFAKGGD